jgi:hypothetical protein
MYYVIQIRVTYENEEQGVSTFLGAKRELARFWLDKAVKVEVRTLAPRGTPKEQWNLNATWEEVGRT